jgi:hypothetical protein
MGAGECRTYSDIIKGVVLVIGELLITQIFENLTKVTPKLV